jgi:hypothetical protein
MHKGIIRENVVWDAEVGLRLVRSTGNHIYANEYSGKSDQAFVLDQASRLNNLENNNVAAYKDRGPDSVPSGKFKPEGSSGIKRLNGELEKLAKSPLSNSNQSGTTAIKPSGDIAVRGQTERDAKTGRALAEFFDRQNPGFLSIEVRGNRVRSEITHDLYLTLKGSGDLGIGLVRAPVRMLRRVSGTIFPVWHLIHGTEEIAIVTVGLAAPGANILFTEDESILKRVSIFSMASVAEFVTMSLASLGYELEDIYYGRRKFLAVGTLLLGALLGVGVVWRIKRAPSR